MNRLLLLLVEVERRSTLRSDLDDETGRRQRFRLAAATPDTAP
jgi:hypothetical protein